MNLLLTFFLLCSALSAQTIPHATGVAHTEQVDLSYENLRRKRNRASHHRHQRRPRTLACLHDAE